MSEWTPSPETVIVFGLLIEVVEVAALSRLYSTWSIPEVASEPWMSTLTGAFCQPEATEVVSVGRSVSILIVCVVQPESRPWPSKTLVSSVCVPSALIVTVLLFGPLAVVAPSSCHWT